MKCTAAVVIASLISLWGAPRALGEGAIGEKFGKGCARCHQAPDLKFATDRAWLDQVFETG